MKAHQDKVAREAKAKESEAARQAELRKKANAAGNTGYNPLSCGPAHGHGFFGAKNVRGLGGGAFGGNRGVGFSVLSGNSSRLRSDAAGGADTEMLDAYGLLGSVIDGDVKGDDDVQVIYFLEISVMISRIC